MDTGESGPHNLTIELCSLVVCVAQDVRELTMRTTPESVQLTFAAMAKAQSIAPSREETVAIKPLNLTR
jgi:hypothetical protein